ncbi:MAG: hypothetical protein H6587_03530 [Flavobacteriales bacterium]|nr:hypothetical protein [Flavobacteriales bacterium]MCB9363620.1 hypothetical protein [Flavobacteriales bacterium]
MNNFNLFHKKTLHFFSSTVLILFFSACASLPEATPIVKRYCVGQGGGFTGEYTEFSFSEDGKVYKRDFVYDRDVYYKDLSPTDLEYFLNKIIDLGIEFEELNQPGNISKYIEIRVKETSRNKITWGAPNYSPPKDIALLFKELYSKLSERP